MAIKKPKRGVLTWLGIVLGGLLLLGMIGNHISNVTANRPVSDNGKKTESAVGSGGHIGQESKLHVAGLSLIMVAVDTDAYDELLKACVAKDNYGIGNLILSGRVFNVKNDTRILVLDLGFAKTQVRILEGQKAGMSGWVPYEWVN
jgi:hypothetical protein